VCVSRASSVLCLCVCLGPAIDVICFDLLLHVLYCQALSVVSIGAVAVCKDSSQ